MVFFPSLVKVVNCYGMFKNCVKTVFYVMTVLSKRSASPFADFQVHGRRGATGVSD